MGNEVNPKSFLSNFWGSLQCGPFVLCAILSWHHVLDVRDSRKSFWFHADCFVVV